MNCALNIFEHVSTLAPLVVVAVLVNVEASDSSAEAALLLFLRLHLPLSLYQLFAPCIFGTVTVTLTIVASVAASVAAAYCVWVQLSFSASLSVMKQMLLGQAA